MIISLLIGSYVDARAAYRKILFFATICCSISTIILGFCGVDDMKLAHFSLFYRMSYAIHQNTTASLLSKIADVSSLGKISGYGWAWGFVGGILSLVLSLWWLGQSFQYFLLVCQREWTRDNGRVDFNWLFVFVNRLFFVISLRNINICPTNLIGKIRGQIIFLTYLA